MTTLPSVPPPPGAAADGADETAIDPIFRGQEPAEKSGPRATLLFQFFLFPLLIVLAAVAVFLFFGAIGGSDKTPSEWLDAVATGGDNVQKQAAHQLANVLRDERRRVQDGTIRFEDAFFVRDEAFRLRLARVFEDAVRDGSAERVTLLAACLGLVGDPAYARVLSARIAPESSPEVRRAVAFALGGVRSDDVVAPLASLLKDPDDSVRNLAVQSLSVHRTAAAVEALKSALVDEQPNVRASAAAALALAGDPAGKELLGNLLDPAWVEALVDAPAPPGARGEPPSGQRDQSRAAALMNGIRGAFALRAADLRPKVVALQKDRDADVRRLARDVLDQWPDGR